MEEQVVATVYNVTSSRFHHNIKTYSGVPSLAWQCVRGLNQFFLKYFTSLQPCVTQLDDDIHDSIERSYRTGTHFELDVFPEKESREMQCSRDENEKGENMQRWTLAVCSCWLQAPFHVNLGIKWSVFIGREEIASNSSCNSLLVLLQLECLNMYNSIP